MRQFFLIFSILAIFYLSLIISYLINSFIIKFQHKKILGTSINVYLTFHQQKKFTPLFGGVGIYLSIIITSLFHLEYYQRSEYLGGMIILSGLLIIGIIDDVLKIKSSYLGLNKYLRLILEIILFLIIYFLFKEKNILDTNIAFNQNLLINLGKWYVIYFIFVLLGSANASNLTDGLDGLCSGLFLISLMPLLMIFLKDQQDHLVFFIIQIYGAVTGFLLLNLYPSKIFLGDSGSLMLGGILGYLSLMTPYELLIVIYGGIFIWETLSVLLQVSYFKIFHRRIFLMSPFHHHLELRGLKEYQIVALFYLIGLILAFLSVVLSF